MSKKFSQIRTKLGLDDVLDFGRHKGYTVLEVIKDRPDYIDWLIRQGKEVYPSVVEELARRKADQVYEKTKRYADKGYLYAMAYQGVADKHGIAGISEDDLDNWMDDVPF